MSVCKPFLLICNRINLVIRLVRVDSSAGGIRHTQRIAYRYSNLIYKAHDWRIEKYDRLENETSIFCGRILLSTGPFKSIQQKGGIFFDILVTGRFFFSERPMPDSIGDMLRNIRILHKKKISYRSWINLNLVEVKKKNRFKRKLHSNISRAAGSFTDGFMWVYVVHITSHYIRSGQSPGIFKTRVFTHSHHHPCRAMLRIGYVAQQTVIITLRDRFVRFSNWWGGMNLGSDSIPSLPPNTVNWSNEKMRLYTRITCFFFCFIIVLFGKILAPKPSSDHDALTCCTGCHTRQFVENGHFDIHFNVFGIPGNQI